MGLKHGARVQLRRKWQRLVEKWRESGLSREAFAREHEVDPKNFCRWCRKLGGARQERTAARAGVGVIPAGMVVAGARFTPVPEHLLDRLTAGHRPAEGGGGELIVVVGDRLRVVVPTNFATEHLVRVVRALAVMG